MYHKIRGNNMARKKNTKKKGRKAKKKAKSINTNRKKQHAGHGKLTRSGYYKRSDTKKRAKYNTLRDLKKKARYKSEPGKPYTGDTMVVYYLEKNGKLVDTSPTPKEGYKIGFL